MSIEYFSWAPIQMGELRQRFDDVLGRDYSEFEREIEEYPDDGDDGAATQIIVPRSPHVSSSLRCQHAF
jgi:hypothetical protein